jgi:PAS domain-containing protein
MKSVLSDKTIREGMRPPAAEPAMVLAQHPDGIVVCDNTGTVRFANPAAEMLFGPRQEGFV